MTGFLQRARGAAGSFSYCAYEKEISLQTPRLCKKTIGKGDKKMKSKKAVRSALGMSVLSIALCAAMLIGTTFAWFTDTASTAVNKIQAGTLDVALEMKDGDRWVSAEGKTLDFVKSPNAPAGEELLWEPGCTYNLPQLRVVNNGNLALKYKVVISGVNGNSKLLKVIDFSVTKQGTGDTPETIDLTDFEGILLPAGKTAGAGEEAGETTPITISGYMKKEAGNEYQGESIDGIAITVYATQYTYEFDSKDNQYDEGSAYKGTQEFTSGEHTLNKGGVALNPNDVAVKVSGVGTNVTITGGYYDGGSGGNNVCVEVTTGATVIIKDGTFTVGGDANGSGNSVIYSLGGDVIIEGGFFYTNYTYNNKHYVLNQNNITYGSIVVKGGTFVNYDPSKGDDNLGGNFVAEGYSVLTQVQPNGDIWYTVVNGEAAGSQEDLKDVIGNLGENGGNVTLGSGTYTLHNVNKTKTQNTTLTLEGAGADKTTFTAGDLTVTDANGEGSSDYSYEGSDVTFKNMTINVGTGNYKGFVRANALYFENCTIIGRGSYWGSGTVVFKNCTFKNDGDYLITTYAGADFTFDGCTFNSDVGKFVNAYKEQHSNITPLTFIDCTFNATTADKAAVCLKSQAAQEWNLSFKNCKVDSCKADGDSKDLTTGSKYYSVRSSDNGGVCPAATTVTIDGKTVWQNGAKVQ